MKKTAAPLIVLLLFVFSCSQVNRLPRKQMPNAMPVLRITNDSTAKNIHISSLQVDIKVAANIAVTTFDIVFFNPNNRVLEGEFEFPLADGQTIVRYALDMDGKLREGVVVEKAKARMAFENTIRRNIDPGLVEKTKGNNFRTRIYPLPAKGTRHIVIAIEQTLDADSKNYFYQLPLSSDSPVEKFLAKAAVIRSSRQPVPDKNNMPGFGFNKSGNDWTAEAGKTNTALNENIAFSIPLQEKKAAVITENHSGQTYFYANIPMAPVYKKKKSPGAVGVFWDISASGEKRDMTKEKQLLENYLTGAGLSNISLIAFNIFANPKEDFASAASLIKRIDELTYDGGTQFGAVDFSRYAFDEVLLFTDGLATFGKKELIFSAAPVIVVNSSSSADFSHLKYIARQSHGKFIDLSKLDEATALQEMKNESLLVISADYNATEIEDLVLPVSPVQSSGISVAGKLKTASASLKLNLGYGDHIVTSQTITITRADKSDYDAVKRVWASMKIAELDLRFEENKEAITALGKEFAVVTQNTSLIVLDRVEDYVEHEITPPEELQKEYFTLLKEKKLADKDKKATALTEALDAMKELKDWWHKNHSPVKAKKAEEIITRVNEQQSGVDSAAEVRFTPPVIVADSRVSDTMEQSSVDLATVTPGILSVSSDSLASSVGRVAMRYDAGTLDSIPYSVGLGYAAPFMRIDVNGDGVTDRFDLSENKPEEEKNEIQANKWVADELYLTELKNTPAEKQVSKYAELRKKYGSQPAFFIDVARFFIEKGDKKYGILVLSNVAEMKLESAELMRMLANQLLEANEKELAVETCMDILKMREEDPQSYRDLALAYNETGNFSKAVELLYKVITDPWDSRFGDVKAIAINEMNAIISSYKDAVNTSALDTRFIYAMPVDVRIVIGWSTDNSDIDLWVTDPRNEQCDYSHNETEIGGRLSRDITQGFGPEEFLLKKAWKGTYKIDANLFGDRRQTLGGPIAIKAELFTNFGRPSQKREIINFRVTTDKEVVRIGSLKFGS